MRGPIFDLDLFKNFKLWLLRAQVSFKWKKSVDRFQYKEKKIQEKKSRKKKQSLEEPTDRNLRLRWWLMKSECLFLEIEGN